MWPAIVASLIGACAVVGGVFLAQWLVIGHNETVDRRFLAKTLKNTHEEFLTAVQDANPIIRGRAVVKPFDMVNGIEAACSHMPRSRRTKVFAILDEYQAILVNVPSRVEQGGGTLPENERQGLFRWTMFVTTVVGEGRPIASVEEMSARLNFYAVEGLDAKRPGAPQWLVPTGGFRSWLRRAIAAMVGDG